MITAKQARELSESSHVSATVARELEALQILIKADAAKGNTHLKYGGLYFYNASASRNTWTAAQKLLVEQLNAHGYITQLFSERTDTGGKVTRLWISW